MIADRLTWNAWNKEQAEGAHNEQRRALTARVVGEFTTLVPEGSSVLDIGIGAGFTTRALADSYRYVGLDISDEGIAIAKQQTPSAELIAADFLDWQLPAQKFDAVLCVDTIAYIEYRAAAIAKMARALRPGGWLVLSTINPFVYSRQRWIQERGHGRMGEWLDKGTLESLIAKNGFDVRRSFTAVPAGDQGWLRALNSRKVKALLGAGYVSLLEELGLGQNRIVIARKPQEI